MGPFGHLACAALMAELKTVCSRSLVRILNIAV